MRKDGTVLGTVWFALVALLLLASSGASAASRCSLAGTWIGTNDAGLAFIITFNPLDNAHKTYSSIAGVANDPTSLGLFPTAEDGSAFLGIVKRTGRYSFDQTALAYTRDNAAWIGTYAVSGAWTLSKDCRTAEVVWHASAFFAGDDPIGGDPFFCFPPISGVYDRVPVVASSCEE